MGRRGGKKAEERWKTDPEGEYVQVRRTALEETNIKRATGGRATARQIANYFDDTLLQTGKYPSIPDTMREFGVSRPTVKRALPTVKRALKNA
ncbi:plasmid replication protein [Corynebacterium striatum]|uniref:Plasmid replication protein n=1 Tax=Corynebacterium striatum TaxID=43770 RepID=A0A2Z2IXW3_CORST|nr:plasmid replication protein [Corynebacterium striatum]OFT47996.1 plasmid replication protein [Corynebacterium sp. HMSC06G04]